MDVERISFSYIKQELFLTVALFLVALLVMRVWFLDEIFVPVLVSTIFTLVVGVAIGMVWRKVAKKSPDNLPTFYTAVSGFRLLMALGVMLVYYLINGGDTMLVFFLVFMVFYFASLIHHSVYFARVSNRL